MSEFKYTKFDLSSPLGKNQHISNSQNTTYQTYQINNLPSVHQSPLTNIITKEQQVLDHSYILNRGSLILQQSTIQQPAYQTVETIVPTQVQSLVTQPVKVQSLVTQPVTQTVVQQPVQVQSVVTQPVQVQSVVTQPVQVQSVVTQPVQVQSVVQQPVKVVQQPVQVVQQPVQVVQQPVIQQPVQVVQQPVKVIEQQPPQVIYVNSPPRNNFSQEQQVLEKTIVKTEYIENHEKIRIYIEENELLKGFIRDKNNLIIEQNKQIEYLEQKIFTIISQQNNQSHIDLELKKSQTIHITLNQEIADLRAKNIQLEAHITQYNIAIFEFERQKADFINKINHLENQIQQFIIVIKTKDENITHLEKKKKEYEEEIEDGKNKDKEQKEQAKKKDKKSFGKKKEDNEDDEESKRKDKIIEDLERQIEILKKEIILIRHEHEPTDNSHYLKLKENHDNHLVTIRRKQEIITEIEGTIQDFEQRIIILTKTIERQEEKNRDQERQLEQYKLSYKDQSKNAGVIQQHMQQFVLLFAEIDSLRERVRTLQAELDQSKKEGLRMSLHHHAIQKHETVEVEVTNDHYSRQKTVDYKDYGY